MPRDSTLAPSTVSIYGAALLTNMMSSDKIVSNDVTAFEQTDAPDFTVVVENRRNPCPRNKQRLHLATWNVRTTNDSVNSCRPERATAIISRELVSSNIDICALSEVRRERTGNIIEKDHTIYWSGGDTKEADVGFAISNKAYQYNHN